MKFSSPFNYEAVMTSPDAKVIPRPEAVQAEIDQFSEHLKRLRRLLKVSEETYGELPKSPATPPADPNAPPAE